MLQIAVAGNQNRPICGCPQSATNVRSCMKVVHLLAAHNDAEQRNSRACRFRSRTRVGSYQRCQIADYEREANSRGSLRLSADYPFWRDGKNMAGRARLSGGLVSCRGVAAVARGGLTGAAPGWWPCSRMHRWDGACHAVAEAGRADAEGQVEAAAHVLQGDVVGQLHELAVVEVLAQPVE
jgi:hypothetical protein